MNELKSIQVIILILYKGRIRMVYPENKAADEHFENLRKQYAGTLTRAKALVDEATESKR